MRATSRRRPNCRSFRPPWPDRPDAVSAVRADRIVARFRQPAPPVVAVAHPVTGEKDRLRPGRPGRGRRRQRLGDQPPHVAVGPGHARVHRHAAFGGDDDRPAADPEPAPADVRARFSRHGAAVDGQFRSHHPPPGRGGRDGRRADAAARRRSERTGRNAVAARTARARWRTPHDNRGLKSVHATLERPAGRDDGDDPGAADAESVTAGLDLAERCEGPPGRARR